MSHVKGIHHITAIASDPQRCVDFYTKTLGLRLVKKSVNQDDVQTYHFFFGDKTGEPGMDLTFFTFQPVMQGMRGVGQVTTISLGVPDTALEFWRERFVKKKVKHDEVFTQFGKRRMIFYDPDQQRLELVGVNGDESDSSHVWETEEVKKEHAIRSFYSAQLSVPSMVMIEPVLKVFGYEIIKKEQQAILLHLKGQTRAAKLEVEEAPDLEMGLNAAGTVHHIAFQVADEQELLQFRQRILELGLYPTEVINRYYFKSVYFRTRAGILFELATSGPGFTVDEDEKELGNKLALPPFLEAKRLEIESQLKPIKI